LLAILLDVVTRATRIAIGNAAERHLHKLILGGVKPPQALQQAVHRFVGQESIAVFGPLLKPVEQPPLLCLC
jgi:hypothetical protein